jgi:hypothetical protein
MPRGKQVSAEQIIAKLREAEVELARARRSRRAAAVSPNAGHVVCWARLEVRSVVRVMFPAMSRVW